MKQHPDVDRKTSHLPTKDDILSFIRENPNLSGKRELAKAFNLKGDARIWLKDLLRELKAEGIVAKQRNKLVPKHTLPPVTLIDIKGRDRDGGFIAFPSDWDGEDAPMVSLHPAKHTKGPAIGVGDRVLAKIFRNKRKDGPAYTARAIKKIDKQELTTMGVLRDIGKGKWRLEPIDRKASEIAVDLPPESEAKSGDLVEVEIGRDKHYGLKRGKVTAILGSIDSEKALSMIAIISHDIPYVFPERVLAEAEAAKPATMDNREDWRDLPLVTIDPEDAKDHDDAVYAEMDTSEDNKGGFIVVVAIADVGYYVRPDSALDKEALKRGNSVYFPDRVVPMLPERISNNLCSLREGEDRPAIAVRMIFDDQGKKRSHSFHRVMMRSAAKLSYVQTQNAIDGKPDEKTSPIVENVLKPLWAAYDALKKARDKRQPLELDLPERKIILDKNGRIKDVVVPPRLDAHKLIEEFMIQANVSAAETLKSKHQPLIYRIHDQPSLAKQEGLREFLHSLGLSLSRSAELTPERFNKILEHVKDTDQQELVNQVVLRTQSQAEYAPENIGHFGLNLRNYAHFTSPIRRYADLTVHRALIRSLKFGNDGLTDEEEKNLDEIAVAISLTERRAMAAERETIDRLVAHFLADKIGAEFTGRIAGVTKSGLFISLDRLGADGFTPISTLATDYYIFDEARHALIGQKSHKGYQLGDSVNVRLVEAQPIAGALRFEMLSAPRPMAFSPVSHHKAKTGARRFNRSARKSRA
ncbi:ribonuclease R [uncultured Bartonella sp.]|uniref:ribonuclease R n=1 Tax=uncultured Bartonella sp. TaxID=104108 RepID=UPI0025E74C9E|nr:ribonuclease R [uncultured Bartonella sp.]